MTGEDRPSGGASGADQPDSSSAKRGFADVLRDAKRGDADALRELHSRYENRVLARVRRLLGRGLRSRYDTVDLAQSVFEDMLRELPAFEDRGEEAFKHWLYTMAENKVRDAWRRRLHPEGGAREGQLVTADGEVTTGRGPGPATQAGDEDERSRLRKVLTSLPVEQQTILTLRDQDGLGYAEIAQRLGLSSADAARMRYARALVALRKAWDSE
jgi:RNA polymerase sigma-70 factor (ECF subfamily)